MSATPDQMSAIGSAARNLLQLAWDKTPRNDSRVISGLTAVGKTFATDPTASAALFRRAIEGDHLREHGYKELSWIARQIVNVAKNDPVLAVEIYGAAYGYAEESRDPTAMGDSVLLPLQSNKRQDYESTWHGLSEALPKILDINIEAGTLAMLHGVDGYIRRERDYAADEEEPVDGLIAFGAITTALRSDHSHIWYRAGGRALQDGPKLLKKFEDHLEVIAGRPDAEASMTRIIAALSRVASVPAVIWASLLIAGTAHAAMFARQLLPLAVAPLVMLSRDTQYQLGAFLRAAHGVFSQTERAAIEAAILALPSDRRGERSKAVLAGCIPQQFIATAEVKAYLSQLKELGQEEAHTPPFKFEITSRSFDTDDYLASEGVSLDDPESAKLRSLMRELEGDPSSDAAQADTLASIALKLDAMERLHKGLTTRVQRRVPAKLYEHATGELAAAAERVSRTDVAILSARNVRHRLKRILLFCARSDNPRYDAKRERRFHESLSWGAPSARTSAADGLMNLTRGQKQRDKEVMAAIRKLARDRVPEVRLQIVQNLAMLRTLDSAWAWSEAERVLKKEVTRGVVGAAIGAVARLAHTDISRAIRLSKIVLKRYRGRTGAGMAACRSSAASLIFDIHIQETHAEADEFATGVMGDVVTHAELIQQLIARYSDSLLVGALDDEKDPNHRARERSIAFYRSVTAAATLEIEKRLEGRAKSESGQKVIRSMAEILDEVSMRLHFAAGADGGAPPSEDQRRQRARLYWETKDILADLARSVVAPVAHHLIQTLEVFIPLDPAGVFALIASSARSAERGGYSFERMAVDLVVRIVERYLADYRAVFADKDRLHDLIDCLDIFVRAGWPAAQSLTFKLGEIWR